METLTINPKSLNFTVYSNQNNTSEVHNHDFFEFLIIQSGTIFHSTLNKTDILTQGNVILLCPDSPHSYSTKTTSNSYDIIIRDSFFKECAEFISVGLYNEILNKKYIKANLSLESLANIKNMINKWQENIDIKSKKALEKIITINLLSLIISEDNVNNEKSSFKELCLFAINRYYSLPDAITLIRNELGYSDVYLGHKFKQTFGCTPLEYINDLRLNYATYLFDTMHFSVSECMNNIGLNSISYFNKIFKKKYGITPSQYKKQHDK